jgi:rod shape-determining protein MreC
VDKQIRRRRAVLLLLVVVSLILLTDYFGESSNSPLHSVQRGIADVLSPIQDGASKVLSPVRDVAGFVSSTANAKTKLAQVQRENNALNRLVGQLQVKESEFHTYQKMLGLDRSLNLHAYGPKGADVVGKDSLFWYDTIEIDRGTSDGVKPNDPVLGPQGLVGVVSSNLSSGWARVTLLTSPDFAVGAMVNGNAASAGLVQPKVANPSLLVLEDVNSSAQIGNGDLVVTSGFEDTSQPVAQSLYPPGIPIGTVSNEDPQVSVQTNQQVNVSPVQDLSDLSAVTVLTHPHAGT